MRPEPPIDGSPVAGPHLHSKRTDLPAVVLPRARGRQPPSCPPRRRALRVTLLGWQLQPVRSASMSLTFPPDPLPVPARGVRGKVRWHVPLLGYVVHGLRWPRGFLVLVVGRGAALARGEVRAQRRRRRTEPAERSGSSSRGDVVVRERLGPAREVRPHCDGRAAQISGRWPMVQVDDLPVPTGECSSRRAAPPPDGANRMRVVLAPRHAAWSLPGRRPRRLARWKAPTTGSRRQGGRA